VRSRSRVHRAFAAILRWRWLIVALYAVILPPAGWLAAGVRQDNAIDRLVVATDAEALANQEFAKVFGSGEYAVLIAEAADPYAPEVLARVDRLEAALAAQPGVAPSSALSIFRRGRAGFEATPEQSEAFRRFATGTAMLREQGLVGADFLAVAVVLDVHGTEERRAALAAVERAIAESGGEGPPLRALRRIGQPYVTDYLDVATRRAGERGFALFMALVVVLSLALYRSVRALVAILITLAACLALSVGFIGLTGGTFSIVSPMVPMTILVTACATLVYVHSRYVDHDPMTPLEEHHVEALASKLVPCAASIAATGIGFAALGVSSIRPVQEMGLWVAVGLALSAVVVFTLFPALQRILRVPTSGPRGAGAWLLRLTDWLPRATYRVRHALVGGALLLSAGGAAALFGVPGVLAPMRLGTHPLEYVDPGSRVHEDVARMEAVLPGLSIAEVWLKGGLGAVSEPEVLTGLHRFQEALEREPDVGGVVSVTTILRMSRYLAGQGDAWPADPDEVEQLAADLEALVPVEPMLQRFVQNHALGQTHLAVLTSAYDHAGFERLRARIEALWADEVARTPALRQLELRMVGMAPLQARMSQELVPTLVESFALTAAIIFTTFLLVFRSGAARIMTMIPSLFAILVMFGFMRVAGIPLNVATILIASTVLGTSENDQIHFVWHYQERRGRGRAPSASVEEALRHALRVAGRAIVFATIINAGGFLAFATSDLPPVRQFGVLTALALVLSMVAGLTALPAALWIVMRARPDPR
jgi:predicted RND superfamily exporter protein